MLVLDSGAAITASLPKTTASHTQGTIGGSAAKGTDHQSLANLLTFWQEYEMTRSRSDLGQFAKDLCTDSSLAAHVKRGLENQVREHAQALDPISNFNLPQTLVFLLASSRPSLFLSPSSVGSVRARGSEIRPACGCGCMACIRMARSSSTMKRRWVAASTPNHCHHHHFTTTTTQTRLCHCPLSSPRPLPLVPPPPLTIAITSHHRHLL